MSAAAEAAPPGLLANPVFRRLFAAQVASLLGSGVTSVALAAFAYHLAGGRATIVVGTALGLRILAFVTVAPIAGVLADRMDRRRLMVGADLVRVALLALFPFVRTVGQVYALIFAINAATALFTPAFEASIPGVVGSTLYTRAIALSRVAVDLEAIGGPLVAGVLIAAVGVRWAFWFDGLTYVFSAILLLSTHLPRDADPAPAASRARLRWRALLPELTLGTRVLWREPALRRALVLHAAEAAAGAAAIVATIVYVHDVLHRGDAAFAGTMVALGGGSSLAAFLIGRRAAEPGTGARAHRRAHLRHHRWAGRTMVAGGALLCLALLPGMLMPGFGMLMGLWVLNGAGQAMIAIPSVGLLAEHTEPGERGRAYSAHFALTHLFWLGTYPAVGYLSRALGVPATFTVTGVAIGLLTLAAGVYRPVPRPHAM